MVVETNLHLGKGIVRGDQFSIRRVVKGIPSSILVSSAQLTLKSTIATADPGLFQKSITSANVAGTGQVENTGASGVAVIRFDINDDDTLLMAADTDYFFDIQVTLSSGDIYTLESGVTSAKAQVTTS